MPAEYTAFWQQYGQYLLFGALGALLGDMVRSRRISLPRIIRVEHLDGTTQKQIDPGILAALFGGALLGMFLDGRPVVAFLGGMAFQSVGPHLLEFAETVTRGRLTTTDPQTRPPREEGDVPPSKRPTNKEMRDL